MNFSLDLAKKCFVGGPRFLALGEGTGFWTLGEWHPPIPPSRPCVDPIYFMRWRYKITRDKITHPEITQRTRSPTSKSTTPKWPKEQNNPKRKCYLCTKFQPNWSMLIFLSQNYPPMDIRYTITQFTGMDPTWFFLANPALQEPKAHPFLTLTIFAIDIIMSRHGGSAPSWPGCPYELFQHLSFLIFFSGQIVTWPYYASVRTIITWVIPGGWFVFTFSNRLKQFTFYMTGYCFSQPFLQPKYTQCPHPFYNRRGQNISNLSIQEKDKGFQGGWSLGGWFQGGWYCLNTWNKVISSLGDYVPGWFSGGWFCLFALEWVILSFGWFCLCWVILPPLPPLLARGVGECRGRKGGGRREPSNFRVARRPWL